MFGVIYTPTEAEAIQNYSRLFRKPEGRFLNIRQQDEVGEIFDNVPPGDIDYIVVSDGEQVSYYLLIAYTKPLLPDVEEVRDLSMNIANTVIQEAVREDLTQEEGVPREDSKLDEWIRVQMWEPIIGLSRGSVEISNYPITWERLSYSKVTKIGIIL